MIISNLVRLSAIYGGTYMLDRPDAAVVYEDGKVVGVSAQGETAKCKKVICDPSYAKEKCKHAEKVRPEQRTNLK